jgi:hypothetical protein
VLKKAHCVDKHHRRVELDGKSSSVINGATGIGRTIGTTQNGGDEIVHLGCIVHR